MIVQLIFILQLLTSPAPQMVHPLHLSVTNIDYNSKQKEVNFAFKFFTDDFQMILNKKYSANINSFAQSNSKQIIPFVNRFLTDNFICTLNGSEMKTSKFDFVRMEQNFEASWFYYKVKVKDPLARLKINVSFFNQIFKDQSNMVFVAINNKQWAYKLNYHKTFFEISDIK